MDEADSNWKPVLSATRICTRDYCITPIFRVEEIFANLDFARNFPPAKIISTANGILRNFLIAV